MLSTAGTVLGGVGLFLLGMLLMTDGLKALAGDALRQGLARFTGSPLTAVASGAAVTALVQSSSATTLATIGFVSAGLLSFNNAIGVVIGANLGTTSTGWIVSLLGLKLSIVTLALPLIGISALARLLGRDRLAQAGTALAGFGLIFVGIDVLQVGMADLSRQVDLSRYAADGLGARLVLVTVGLVMTVILQSSSAAVATTLTALAAGTLNLEQAAALVIGQNLGTTVTAALAAVGAQTAAKRTALVHIVFNLGTGALAFLLLPVFTLAVDRGTEAWVGDDQALTLAAFHTAFNLMGAVLFVPLIPQLARLAETLLPERRSPLTRHLDASLTTVPALALDAARRSLEDTVLALVAHLRQALLGGHPQPSEEQTQALAAISRFLAQLPEVESQRQADWLRLIQQLAHAQSLAELLQHRTSMTHLLATPQLDGQRRALRAALESYPAQPLTWRVDGAEPRAAWLAATAARQLSVEAAFECLAGQRVLEQLVQLLERLRGEADFLVPRSGAE